MKVLVIGASGLVGFHCLKYFKEQNIEIIGTHRSYKTNGTYFFDPLSENCFNFLNEIKFKPKVIIHCGALTNVDYCEEFEKESKIQNVLSTRIIAKYCSENKIKLVYLSTDYVFDGSNGPYTENDLTNPINIYGKHKLAAEKIVIKTDNYIISRITNVYGEEERSKNFIAFILSSFNNRIEKIINLPYDQFATPIYARDIAKMLYLLIIDNKNGIYNLSSTDYYNRYQLAVKVKSYFKDSSHLKFIPKESKLIQQKAKRPLNGGLLNNKFIKEYPQFVFTNIDAFILKNKKNEI